MVEKIRLLALIPARGGSKRLPRKNVLDLAGRPMIAWTIEAGLQSKYIDRVVVSTDDDEIIQVSRKYGADVPFKRPEDLAGDHVSSIDVVRHTIKSLKKEGEEYEYLIFLQPTSPLRTAEHIDAAIELLLEKRGDSVIGVTKTSHPIEWTNTLPKDLSMEGFFRPEYDGVHSRDFPVRYQLNGAIYINRVTTLLQSKSLINCGKTYAYIMRREHSVDIDVYVDFLMAEALLVEAQETRNALNC
jgi:CMP-N,N'-diacetyllegionaminic acid synthase